MTLGFYFNEKRCLGCRTCVIACKDINDLVVGNQYRRVASFETGFYPDAASYHVSIACNHCDSPACVQNCPTGAMYKAEDGTVLHDDDICIGCKTCVESCPYGAPQFIEADNIVRKCDACAARRAAGKNPACTDACAMRALEFGDVEELKAKHAGEGELVSELPCLPSAQQTSPSLLILPRPAALATDFRGLIE